MKQINGQIDINDYDYVVKRFGKPFAAQPAPLSLYKTGQYKGQTKINPQVTRFFYRVGKFIETVSIVHIKPIYYLTWNGEWRPLSEITHGFGNHWATLKDDFASKVHPRFMDWWMKRMDLIKGSISFPLPALKRSLIYAVVTTVFPDPDPETTTVDGRAYRNGVNEDWATIIAGAGLGASDTQASVDSPVINCEVPTADRWSVLTRSIALFDATSIPDLDEITATILSFSGTSKEDAGTAITPNMDIYTSTPATNTAIVSGDYTQVGSTSQTGSPITFANYSTTGYNDFTFNATGRGNVSKTAVSKFGNRNQNYDVAAVAPAWSSPAHSHNLVWAGAETAGTGSDPKLAVTHAAAGNIFFGVTL
jgi:hypothetical protein